MIETLVRLLRDAGIKWKRYDDTLAYPTIDDMEEMLEVIATRMADEPIGSQLEIGGLIVRKETTGYDVYAYVGPFI